MAPAISESFTARCPCGRAYTFPISSLPNSGPPTPILCEACGKLFTWSEAESQAARANALAVALAKEETCRSNRWAEIDWSAVYWGGYSICFALVFLGCYIYCVAAYGFLLGLGLGWLPSAIAALLISFLWPIVALLTLVVIVAVLVALTR